MTGKIVSSVITSQPSPLQIVLGVFLCSLWSSIAYSWNYMNMVYVVHVLKVGGFKRLAVVHSAKDEILSGLQDVSSGYLLQIVTDNFDAFIRSQNYWFQCHGMSVLSTQWKNDLDGLGVLDSTIPRLSNKGMKHLIAWETCTIEYIGHTVRNLPCHV